MRNSHPVSRPRTAPGPVGADTFLGNTGGLATGAAPRTVAHAFRRLSGAAVLALAAGSTSAFAQSAGCLALDGFTSDRLEVRGTRALMVQPFTGGEVITLTATSVVTSEPVGTPVWAFSEVETGGFGENTISETFLSSDTPVSEMVTIPDAGISVLSLTEFGPWFTDLIGVEITCGGGASGPSELGALVMTSASSARLIVMGANGVARDLGQVSIATRAATPSVGLATTQEGGTQVVASAMNAPGLVGPVFTWAQVTGFRSEQTGSGVATVDGTGIQIGADVAIGPDMVAGVSLGYSDISANNGAVSQDGDIVFLQPYLAYRADAWHANASLIYGRGQFDQTTTSTSTAGEGTADTELFALTFEGGYDVDMANGTTVTPTFGLLAGREFVDGTGGTLEDAGSDTFDFAQASVGVRVQYDWDGGSIFGGLHADYLTQNAGSVLADEFLTQEGWTGRVELGTTTELSNGLGLASSIEFSELGGSSRTLSAGLRVALTF